MVGKTHGNAAVRQHFLPRFLLRGFSVRQGKKQHYVYEFRGNGVVRRGEVGTVGFQRRFYGSDDLENNLADLEGSYASFIQTLRTSSLDSTMKPQIDEFVSHLIVRTNNLRKGLVQMGRAMAEGMAEQFERVEPGSVLHGTMRQVAHSAETRATIDREIKKLPAAARPLYQQMVQEWIDSPLLVEQLRVISRQAIDMIDIPKAVRDAQVQILDGESSIQKRAELLQPFTWQVVEYEPNALVLGDHGPLGQEKAQISLRHPIMMEGVTMIYLPISHQRLLVGARNGGSVKPDPEYLNINSVELNQEFFVAREDSTKMRGYLSSIGKRCMLYEPQEMRNLIEEGLKPE